MPNYFISVERQEFFFSTKSEQKRPDISFKPVVNIVHTHQDVRENLLHDGYKEIDNPVPECRLQTVHALLVPEVANEI